MTALDLKRARRQTWLAWCIACSAAATIGGIVGWVTVEQDK